MKRILIYSLFSFCSLLTFAQQVNIKGNIFDQTKNQPLGFVSVALLRGDSLLNGVTSDEKGAFKFENIEKGVYILKASFIGYETIIKKFNITGKNLAIDFGALQMKEDSKLLKDVEIVAQGSQMKLEVDKKVFTVDQNIASAGGSVSEVLQNIPSVEVDGEGNVSLRNNSNVEIYINGKPSGLTDDNKAQVLQQMPANTIQSIELITNPSAKYSPEGSAGIINLVLKKDNKPGYYGNAMAGVMYPFGGKMGETAGININYNNRKIESSFNIGVRNFNHEEKSFTDRYYLMNDDTTAVLRQNQNITHFMRGVNGRFGLTYHITDKHSIGITAFGIKGNGKFETTNKQILQKDSLSEIFKTNDEAGNRSMGNATLDYLWAIDKKGSELRSSLAYTATSTLWDMGQRERNMNDLQSINVPEGSLFDRKQYLDLSNTKIQLKTDFAKKFSEKSKLESGFDIKRLDRLSVSSAVQKSGTSYVDVPSMYNDYVYHEQIYAAYASFSSNIKKLTLQGGLRTEYTSVNTSTKAITDTVGVTRNDFQFYPTVFCAYSISKNDELQLNYTRRIDRPNGRQLNPFHDYSDSTNITYGNPSLKPEFSSAFELNYIKTYGKKKDQTLSSSVYYKYTDNVIQDVRFIDAGVMNTTSMNISQSQSSGFELISKNTLAKFFNLTSTVNLYYYALQASDYSLSSKQKIHVNGNESFSWNARMIGYFMISKTFSGQLTGNYASPKAIAQGEKKGYYSIDLGARKSFFNRRLTMAISVRDVFNTRKHISTTSGENFTQYAESYSIGPLLNLNASYNFGNMDNKKKLKNKQNQDDLNNDQENTEDF